MSDKIFRMVVKDQIQIDTDGLTCPHCAYVYTAAETHEACSHRHVEGIFSCVRCSGQFEWIRWTRVFYSSRAIPHVH